MNDLIVSDLFTESGKLMRLAHQVRVLAEESNDPLLSMVHELLEFADTGRPIGDWKAAEAALKNFKRNY